MKFEEPNPWPNRRKTKKELPTTASPCHAWSICCYQTGTQLNNVTHSHLNEMTISQTCKCFGVFCFLGLIPPKKNTTTSTVFPVFSSFLLNCLVLGVRSECDRKICGHAWPRCTREKDQSGSWYASPVITCISSACSAGNSRGSGSTYCVTVYQCAPGAREEAPLLLGPAKQIFVKIHSLRFSWQDWELLPRI